jgi:hypothetical protein
MVEIKKRHAEVKKQDWPIPIEVLHVADKILEREWRTTKDRLIKKKCEEMGTWFLGGFCVALRGEEMLLIELAGTANSLRFLEDSVASHFCFCILGRTKGNQLSGTKFEMPCVAITLGTNIRPGRWVKQLVTTIYSEGRRSRRLFQRKLSPSQICELEDDFFSLLERVQSNTDLIEEKMELQEEAGTPRIIRRGATDHAINMQVDPLLIKAMNRWRDETQGRAGNVGYNMIDRYSTLDSLKPTCLRYSNSL